MARYAYRTRITIQDIAEMINENCECFKYFWAYGLLRETADLWKDGNEELLCETAKIILIDVEEERDGKLSNVAS